MKNAHAQQPLAIVADDDPTIRLLARTALEQIGFSVIDVEDGSAALEAARTASPDIVFLDVSMPVIDGFAACREMRKRFDDSVPIVMITGMDDVVSINTAYEAGATDFITKPVNWELFKHRTQFAIRWKVIVEAWREAKGKTDAIIDALPDTIVHVGPDGRVLDFKPGSWIENKAFVGSVGDRLQEAAPGLVDDDSMSLIEGVARSRQPYSLEHSARLLGQEREYELRIVPIGEEDALCVFRDNSMRRMYSRFFNDLEQVRS